MEVNQLKLLSDEPQGVRYGRLISLLQLQNIKLQVLILKMMKQQNLTGYKLKSYNLLNPLGSGQFSTVYQAFNEQDYSTVAIKAIPLSLLSNPKMKELAQSEIKIMKSLKENPNIVKFIDNFKTEQTVIIVMQYCEGGDLQEQLQKKKRFTEDEAIGVLKQILNGFKGLHQNNVMHRDFKAANIMIKGGVYKIADLGFAKMLDSKNQLTQTFLGTALTQAPEIYEQKPYGMNADIWSLGVVFYQLIYGYYPYEGKDDYEIYKKSKSQPSFSGVNLKDITKDFINRCLTFDPNKRFTWAQLYNHPLINEKETIRRFGSSSNNQMLQKNKKFYNQDFKLKNLPLNTVASQIQQKKGQLMEKKAIELAKQQNETKKRMQAAIEKYKNEYLNYRNNIVFLMKYLFPNACYVTNIKMKHQQYLFVICKCTYQKLKILELDTKQKVNFLAKKEFFQEFTKSSAYLQLIQMFQSDAELAYFQTLEYNPNFKYGPLNKQQIQQQLQGKAFQYENLLTDGIQFIKTDFPKRKLIIMIEALNYLSRCKEADQYQQFQKQMQKLDYEKAPSIILKRQTETLSKLYL